MRLGSFDRMETEALIQPIRPLILQSDAEPDALSTLLRTRDNVVEHSRTHPPALLTWQ
jgi:hypothetical protein